MPKLTFDEALERLNEERGLHASGVLASALKRKVWVAEWHLPGCLSESRSYCTTKADAVTSALAFAGDEPPRGMATNLRQYGLHQHRTDMYGAVVTTVEQMLLAHII